MVCKTLKVKGYGLLANVINSVKDDAELAKRVRQVVAQIEQEDELRKAREAAEAETTSPPPTDGQIPRS